MKIYIPVCDRYIDCIKVLKYTIDKHWSKDLDITIIGYTEPIFNIGNWKFISIGKDRGPDYFCEDMYNFFSSIKDEYFIFLNEDWPIARKVDTELLDKLISYLDKDVGRIGLTKDIESRDKPYKIIEDNIIELDQKSNYRNSLLCSIWNREYFLRYMKMALDEGVGTSWGFEISQSKNALDNGYKILGTKDKYVISLIHLYHRGSLRGGWTKLSHSNETITQEDFLEIKNLLKLNL